MSPSGVALHTIALFAGGGGLELGIKRAFRGVRTVCYVEREAYAAAVLVARMEDKALDEAPVWSDVKTFDGKPWRGKVDLIAGGFPCQDVSVAGKRAGITGEKSGLWSEFVRVISEVRPRYVFVENVPGLLANPAMGRVLADLASLGFDARWTSLRASDVGAPHRRERVFLLGVSNAGGGELRQEQEPWRPGATELGDLGEEKVDDASGADVEGRLEERAGPGCGRIWPPPPDDLEGWREYIAQGGPEPALCRSADGMANRVDRLRLIGNGVVPDQAALAFERLASEFLV